MNTDIHAQIQQQTLMRGLREKIGAPYVDRVDPQISDEVHQQVLHEIWFPICHVRWSEAGVQQFIEVAQ